MSNTARLARTLLPVTGDLQLQTVTLAPSEVCATLVATRSAAPCPLCGYLSRSIHSRYQPTLADLPWSQHRVRLVLTMLKFFCEVTTGVRRIFTELLPGVVAPYARRTTRLADILHLLAFALGGEAGARVVERLGLSASPPTRLRLVRRTALPDIAVPRVLGVNDWAFRRGHRYGTILVDLEARRVLDVLFERQAGQFAAWLSQHPGVAVIIRDRAQVYADGARRGASRRSLPLAQEPRRGTGAILVARAPCPARGCWPGTFSRTAAQHDRCRKPCALAGAAEAESPRNLAPKLAQYEQVVQLRAAGAAIQHIAVMVGISRPTVYRYLSLDGPPDRPRPHRARKLLTPYQPCLRRHWAEGCHTTSVLVRELRTQGYVHGASNVYRFLKQVAQEGTATPAGAASRQAIPSPRHVASLLVQRPKRLTADNSVYLSRLCAQAPVLAASRRIGPGFRRDAARARPSASTAG